MSEALVPVAEPVDVARTGPAQRVELVLPQLIVDAGPAAVGKFLEFFAARIANRHARGVRVTTGGPWGSFWPGARRARAGARGGLAAARGGLHPDPPRVGAHGTSLEPPRRRRRGRAGGGGSADA